VILSFKTLGCKTNQFETGALQTLFTDRGHRLAEPGEVADAVVINTCAVTAESSRKSRQAVRRARTDHPEARIAVCGCLSQLGPGEIETLGADLVAGSGDRAAFVADLERVVEGQRPLTEIASARGRHDFELLPAGGPTDRTRALLKVQDGCDNFCTYCIVPLVRGPIRSMPMERAVAEARRLAEKGFQELVITGIEISSYGRDLVGENRLCPQLPDLIAAICDAVPDLRVRLGSLEPRTVTADFCDRLKGYKNLCPHFHLSLQSGSDETLRRMGRRYNTEWYFESLGRLRAAFPDVAITTDLIVGFPGEWEADFDKSLAFLQKCAFSDVHVFPYSQRAGTKAAELPDQIEKAERHRRAKLAGAVVKELRLAWLKGQIGKTMPVLFEREENGFAEGYTPNYCTVSVPEEGLQNQIWPVVIQSVSGKGLRGERLPAMQ